MQCLKGQTSGQERVPIYRSLCGRLHARLTTRRLRELDRGTCVKRAALVDIVGTGQGDAPMTIEVFLIVLSLFAACGGITVALVMQAKMDTARATEHVAAFQALACHDDERARPTW
jgi:hypothetical protein